MSLPCLRLESWNSTYNPQFDQNKHIRPQTQENTGSRPLSHSQACDRWISSWVGDDQRIPGAVCFCCFLLCRGKTSGAIVPHSGLSSDQSLISLLRAQLPDEQAQLNVLARMKSMTSSDFVFNPCTYAIFKQYVGGAFIQWPTLRHPVFFFFFLKKKPTTVSL